MELNLKEECATRQICFQPSSNSSLKLWWYFRRI